MAPITYLYLAIIVIILVGVAVGRYPRLRMNRATISLVGATSLIALGAIPLEKAYAALDMNTLVLLFAMMIINVNLRLAGFFQLITCASCALPARPGSSLLYWSSFRACSRRYS